MLLFAIARSCFDATHQIFLCGILIQSHGVVPRYRGYYSRGIYFIVLVNAFVHLLFLMPLAIVLPTYLFPPHLPALFTASECGSRSLQCACEYHHLALSGTRGLPLLRGAQS